MTSNNGQRQMTKSSNHHPFSKLPIVNNVSSGAILQAPFYNSVHMQCPLLGKCLRQLQIFLVAFYSNFIAK